jgi:hypothetical protein
MARFLVLTATIKMAVFWDVAPCSLVEIDRSFREAYCLYHQSDGLNSATFQKTIIFKMVFLQTVKKFTIPLPHPEPAESRP